MGTKGIKATNIYQNPGIKNTPGIITDPSIKGVGSPAKHKGHEGKPGHEHSNVGNLTKKETVPVPVYRGETAQINLGGGKSILGLELGPRGHKYTSTKKENE